MRISDWSSDVCSSDLHDDDLAAYARLSPVRRTSRARRRLLSDRRERQAFSGFRKRHRGQHPGPQPSPSDQRDPEAGGDADACVEPLWFAAARSEEHTSELQSLMRIAYAVFCLTKQTKPLN